MVGRSTTPGKPRVSGIPPPAKSSGIPTPGRFRSSSNVNPHTAHDSDTDYASRALADAIKANDPSQHRSSLVHGSSPSSSSRATLFSGRRSVAGRPSSAASIPGVVPARAKTPSARPPSRQSDTWSRTASRSNRTFEIGENVRIESLGYEGTLRYIGEIDGKPGLWAGVELGGGFVGKGKNDGSANGKRYFTCPNNCGVFVAFAKLSRPTVGLTFRPSSAASSRSGRITPSFSGRITPSASISLSSGRDRKSNVAMHGRITPCLTPSAGKLKQSQKSSAALRPDFESQITSGSRASRYVGLTAKQLSSRSPGKGSHLVGSSPRPPSSPTRTLDSDSRLSGLTCSTPKARAVSGYTTTTDSVSTAGVKHRPSLNTPRPRIPSSVAMPPPPSPAQPSSSPDFYNDISTQTSRLSVDNLPPPLNFNASTQSPQGEVNPHLAGDPTATNSVPTSVSSNSLRPIHLREMKDEAIIATLSADLDNLQKETISLRNTIASLLPEAQQRLSAEKERDVARSSMAEMEKDLRSLERKFSEKDSKCEALERSHSQTTAELERLKAESETRMNDLQAKIDTSESLVKSLKEAIQHKEGAEHESDALLKAKNAEITLLRGRLEKVSSELDIERRELGGQIDELRQAGQETIALYEERLSGADSKRYELEDQITMLEEQVRKANLPLSPGATSRGATAAEIDNETLREQVQHLQKKLSAVEDCLEDVRAASEREEANMREKILRFKEKEDAMRNELNEGRKTVEQVLKSETLVKCRVEELEEALRESTLALENAQAEIETLRSDVAAADAGVNGQSNVSQKVSAISNRDIQDLGQVLRQPRSTSQISNATSEEALWRSKYENECAEVLSLKKRLEEQSLELETMRKRFHCELPLNGLTESAKGHTPKHESEEIRGLKHIVQELQKEIVTVTQRNKLLESENRLLISETDQLRQELKILEENVEQTLLCQEAALDSEGRSGTSRDLQNRHEGELEQLCKRLADAEMKTARVTHDLNKEISELETLVESKVMHRAVILYELMTPRPPIDLP
ncbi:hypothetical protein EDC04DRAFT_2632497 [Pisolithus marmoratus]|nr:hypothetical protein EDC04DRAFT_2632497 [Pisolithus marmoratus]